MAVTWTTIPNGDVDVDSPVTTALMTSLRDNPEGIAQRATGAPKIWGTPYDYQEFTFNGTWTKPSNAETGDFIVIQIIGGGGSGALDTGSGGNEGGGGAGGAGTFFSQSLDDIDATVAVTVGAGGPQQTASNTNGTTGGNSTFPDTKYSFVADGGENGFINGVSTDVGGNDVALNGADLSSTSGGRGSGSTAGVASNFGGGGGGAGESAVSNNGGPSKHGGIGGFGGNDTRDAEDGLFPGGGGGGGDTTFGGATSGKGGDGVVRVWCIKED